MSTVVERAAAAMFKVDYPKDNWERLGAGGFHQTRYCNMVRAAIGTMREPSEEMLDAYWHQTGESKEMRLRTHAYMRRYFTAMIDAALAATPSGGAR